MAKFLNKDLFTYQEEQREFLKELERFHAGRGTPFCRIPRFNGKDVDLYALYRRVIDFGGWRKVIDDEVWEQLSLEFNLPSGCSNATQGLKHIYVRYLDKYEMVHFHGEDPDRKDNEEEGETPRKKICLPIYGIPLSYNYGQHRVLDSTRQALNFSTDFVNISEYDKLEKALLSGLPNEVDFVINVCTLLSSEGKHVLKLRKTKRLLELLMAHVGVFDDEPGGFEQVYEKAWRVNLKKDFVQFWWDTVPDSHIRELIYSSLDYKQRNLVGSEVLNIGRDLGKNDLEGQRVLQIVIILRNLSFEADNARKMCESNLVYRFLMLCTHCSYGCVKTLGLDTFCNMAQQMILNPKEEDSDMLVEMIAKWLAADDKLYIVRGLEILSKLCQTEQNSLFLEENLEDRIYDDIVRLLGVYDIQIIVNCLEALYQLSEIGEATTTKIAAVKRAVDFLVTLLTIEAQSFGPNSLVGIKVVEYCPPPQPGDHPAGQNTPAISNTPKSVQTVQKGIAPANCDVEATTCNWLQSMFELKDGGCSLSQLYLYTEYMNFSKKYNMPQRLPAQAFLNCVRSVFPKLAFEKSTKEDGSHEILYKGIAKRANPLPFAIHCNPIKRSSHVHPSASPSASSSSNAFAIVDLTQTSPTLRQRLMEPPKLSSLQACPSLLPIGGAPASGSSSAISTSTVSSPSLSQVHQTTVSSTGHNNPRMAPRNLAQQLSKNSTSAPNSPTIQIQQQSNVNSSLGVIQAKPVLVIPPAVQASGQLDSGLFHDQKPNTETKMIKTLLAKKLRNQGPVPICPKIDPTNPVQLLTFTTQQGTVIQEQLQQPFLTSAASLPQQTTVFNAPPESFQQVSMNTDSTQYTLGGPVFSPAVSSNSNTSSQPPQSVITEKTKKKKKSGQSSLKQANSPKGNNSGQDIGSTTMEVSESVSKNSDMRVGQAPTNQLLSKSFGQENSKPSTFVQSMNGTQAAVSDMGSPLVVNSTPTTNYVPKTIEQAVNVFPSVLDLAVSAAGIGEDSLSSSEFDQNVSTCAFNSQIGEMSPAIYASESSAVSPTETVDVIEAISSTVSSSENDQNNSCTPVINENVLQTTQGTNDTKSEVSKADSNNYLGVEQDNATIHSKAIGQEEEKDDQKSMKNGVTSSTFSSEDDAENYLENLVSDPTPLQIPVSQPQPTVINGHTESQTMSKNALPVSDSYKETYSPDNHINQNHKHASNCNKEHPIVNGGCEYADGEEDTIIPSPQTNSLVNGVDDDVISEDKAAKEKATTDQIKENLKRIYEKMGKVNGVQSVLNHVENGDAFDDDSNDVDYEMGDEDLEDDPEEFLSDKPEDSSSQDAIPHVVIQAEENDSVTINEQGQLEINGKVTDVDQLAIPERSNMDEQSLAIQSILGETPVESEETPFNDQYEEGSSQCMEIAGESNDSPPQPMQIEDNKPSEVASSTAPEPVNEDQESDDVIIENEMCLKPTPTSISSAVDQAVAELMEGASPITDLEESQDAPLQQPETSGNLITVIPKVLDASGTCMPVVNQTMTQVVTTNFVTNQIAIGNTLATPVQTVFTANPPILGQQMIGQTFIGQPIIGQAFTTGAPVLQFKSVKDLVNDSALRMGIKPDQFIINQPTTVVSSGGYCVVSNPGPIPVNVATCSFPVGTYDMNDQTKVQSVEICTSSRHVPTPEGPRESEYSCDSVSSSTADSSQDKHSTSSCKSPSSTTPSSKKSRSKSGDKSKSKKRSRNSSGADSKSSTSPALSPAPATPAFEYMCDWYGCKRCFENSKKVFIHVMSTHLKRDPEGVCMWEGCEKLRRKRWSLVTHIQDHHCSELALKAAAVRRQKAQQQGASSTSNKAQTIPALVYPADAAWQAIRRFTPKPPFPEFAEQREGPVTKHIRLTAALILRNLSRYSPLGRSLIKRHESHINYTAMSALESSNTLATCLFELLHQKP